MGDRIRKVVMIPNHMDSIICLGDNWGERKRPEQLMRRLAQHFAIIYVEPPFCILSFCRHPISFLKSKSSRRKLWRTFKPGLWQAEPNIFLLTPWTVSPFPLFYRFRLRAMARFMIGVYALMLARSLRRIQGKQFSKRSILWLCCPDAVSLLDHFRAKLVIYDCMDQWDEFPGLLQHPDWKRDWERGEEILVKKADLVICSSKELLATKKGVAKHAILLRNAADFDHFKQAISEAISVPSELEGIKSPVIGYIGALASWIDFGLVAYIARSRPEWSIVLIGPVFEGTFTGAATDLNPITDLANVHLLGPKDYQSLPAYLKAFDVGIIPFKLNKLTMAVNPIKVYEYLAAGKPVVSTDLPEVRSLVSVVKVASDCQDFLGQIELILGNGGNGDALVRSRLEVAQNNSWDSRATSVLEKLEDLRKARTWAS